MAVSDIRALASQIVRLQVRFAIAGAAPNARAAMGNGIQDRTFQFTV
jgi:hypothetical protein